MQDRAAVSPNNQTAIVKSDQQLQVAPPAPRTIQETVKDLERVRRFVTSCLNVDLQKAEARAKLLKTPLKDFERQDLEVDWGTIPGVNKPFLKQPGAEKVLFWLGLKPKWTKLVTELGNGHLEISSFVTFFSKKTGEQVFEGPECSCSTMESNYRFRWVPREENEAAPNEEECKRVKSLGVGKWKEIWRGWGQNKKKVWTWHDRFDNPNIHDERNKVRQIGQKRALVKGVKNMGAMSELFAADPSEWDLGNDPDEGSPATAADYTASGGTIVETDTGRTPSGRPVTGQAWQTEKDAIAERRKEELTGKMNERDKEQAQTAAKPAQDVPGSQPKQEQKVIWNKPHGDYGDQAVTGFIEDIKLVNFLADIAAPRAEDSNKRIWYKVEAVYWHDFLKLCQQLGLKVLDATTDHSTAR